MVVVMVVVLERERERLEGVVMSGQQALSTVVLWKRMGALDTGASGGILLFLPILT